MGAPQVVTDNSEAISSAVDAHNAAHCSAEHEFGPADASSPETRGCALSPSEGVGGSAAFLLFALGLFGRRRRQAC